MLYGTLGPRDFVACALAVVEPVIAGHGGNGDQPCGVRLHLSSAAQVRPLLCRAGTATELAVPGERLPLGVLPAPEYLDLTVDLEPDDVVLFATDGLPEAPARPSLANGPTPRRGAVSSAAPALGPALAPPAETGELFGFDRLEASAAFWAAHATSAEAVLDGIWSDVAKWCSGDSLHDDMTLLVLRVSARGGDMSHG
jgi:serine phosphatase RsbU (regulator of sigma subunit)